jgi:hypothetical protein
MQIRIFKCFAGLVAVTFAFAVRGVAYAHTTSFTCHASGTAVSVPVDIDSDSCFTAENGATVCTDTSGYGNFGFKCSPGGRGTGTNVFEFKPVSGSGCNILGTAEPIASCTLANSSEAGCEFQSVVGGAEVDRNDNTGDLTFATANITLCLDLSSGPPFNFTASANDTITGGTGANTGATGSATAQVDGQILIDDLAGHAYSWSEGTSTGTITTK